MRYQTLIPPIKYCKICFQNIEQSLSTYTFAEEIICEKCFKEMGFDLATLSLDKVRGWSLYPYNEKIKTLIYQLKGCNDIDLAAVFLSKTKFITRIRFKNYIIVPIPSWHDDDELRGFNHVEEIFKSLNLQMEKALQKNVPFKQSSLKMRDRQEVINKLSLLTTEGLKNKNVLLVDDILTSGSTMKAAIRLIKEANPRRLHFLVIAATCRKM